MPKKDFHVLIIGGGSTGLLIAQGLLASNIPFTVYEQHDPDTYRYRQRNWTMAIHWGSSYINSLLPASLNADLKHAKSDPHITLSEQEETSLPFVNGKTGEVIARASAESTQRVSKEKLRELFSRGLNIEYNKRLVDIVEKGGKVVAKFKDGSEAEGDMLVGCDAGKSVVRHWLLGREKAQLEELNMELYNITQSYTAEQARSIREMYHPIIKLMIHPERQVFFFLAMADVPDPADPSTWIFQLIVSHYNTKPPGTSAERLARIKELTTDICEPFRSAAQLVKDDTHVSEDHIYQWTNPVAWPNHNGHVTLAGDAAHCMSPYRGQGLNNALQDAAMFVEAMRRVFSDDNIDTTSKEFAEKLKAEVDAYDVEVLERGKKEIMISGIQLKATHIWENFMESPMVKQGLHVRK